MDITDTFKWENEVRDNELDFQGIVNNSNYLIYLAIARHKHLKVLGLDIVGMHDQGFDLVLTRAEIDYKGSLKLDDKFIVTSKLEPSGRIRFSFAQQIIRKSDQKIMIEAKNIGVCLDRSTGRPIVPDVFKSIFSI